MNILRETLRLNGGRVAGRMAADQGINVGMMRRLATHRDHPSTSSFLSDQLDRSTNRGASSSTSHGSVGPFQLGTGTHSMHATKPKRWSELTAGGKVMRGTARTTNLTVILLGGTLSCVLAYALATELFAKNSPSVLYDDACHRIQSSQEVRILTFFFLPQCPKYII